MGISQTTANFVIALDNPLTFVIWLMLKMRRTHTWKKNYIQRKKQDYIVSRDKRKGKDIVPQVAKVIVVDSSSKQVPVEKPKLIDLDKVTKEVGPLDVVLSSAELAIDILAAHQAQFCATRKDEQESLDS